MADLMSHKEFKEAAQNIIQKMMKIDSVLDDLHPQITSNEVKSLIQLEHGKALIIYVLKDYGSPWKLIVPKDATVQQLKLALKARIKLKLTRQKVTNRTTLSWKYIWKMHWLSFQQTLLMDDNKQLIDYGIVNKSKLTFVQKFETKKLI